MPREWELRLRDILNACYAIITVVRGITFEDFVNDQRNPDSVSYNFIVIGEAIKDLPNEITDQFPNIKWKEYAKFRDFLAHRYFDTDINMVWEAANTDTYTLVKIIEELLKNLS